MLPYLVAINLGVIAISIIASIWFADLAREKGYVASQARKYVFVVGCAGLFLVMVGQSVLSFIVATMNMKLGGLLLVFGWSGFVILAFITILYKAYQNMKKAPTAGMSKESHEEREEV